MQGMSCLSWMDRFKQHCALIGLNDPQTQQRQSPIHMLNDKATYKSSHALLTMKAFRMLFPKHYRSMGDSGRRLLRGMGSVLRKRSGGSLSP